VSWVSVCFRTYVSILFSISAFSATRSWYSFRKVVAADGCVELDATMVDGSCNVSWFQRELRCAPASVIAVVSVEDWGEDSIAFGLCGSGFCDCKVFLFCHDVIAAHRFWLVTAIGCRCQVSSLVSCWFDWVGSAVDSMVSKRNMVLKRIWRCFWKPFCFCCETDCRRVVGECCCFEFPRNNSSF
jgi:hypothetical protein